MLSLLTGRSYIIIAIIVGGLLYLLSLIDTSRAIAGFFTTMGVQAQNAGMPAQVVRFVVAPLEIAFGGELIGVVLGAVLWPLGLIWLLLVVLLLILSFLAPLFSQLFNIV